MKRYQISVNGQSYDVTVEELEGGAAMPAPAPKPAPAAAPAPAAEPAKPQAPAGGTTVPSPMPGVIVDVRAQEGQKVEAGDVLVVLEAMKMENDIVAPVAGTVSSVLVKKGDTVESNQTIITIA